VAKLHHPVATVLRGGIGLVFDRLVVQFTVGPFSCNIGQLSLASLRGRYIEYLLQLGVKAGFPHLPGGRQQTLCDPIWHVSFRSGEATLLLTAIHCLLYLIGTLRGLVNAVAQDNTRLTCC